MGPNPTGLESLEEEGFRAQAGIERRPHRDTGEDGHLLAEERGVSRSQLCPRLQGLEGGLLWAPSWLLPKAIDPGQSLACGHVSLCF